MTIYVPNDTPPFGKSEPMDLCISLPDWWPWVALGVVYFIGWALTARAVAWESWANWPILHEKHPTPDLTDRSNGIMSGIIWPLVLLSWLPFIGMRPKK